MGRDGEGGVRGIAARLGASVAALVLAACAGSAGDRTPAAVASGLTLGSFRGVTPCADCPGIDTELTLTREHPGSGEGTFRLTETYLERSVAPLVTNGDWTTLRGVPGDTGATVYALNPDRREATRYFLKVGDDRVTMLDRERRPIQSDLNFTLAAQPAGLANPASVNCARQGGVPRVAQEAQGWRGVCRFLDGRVCDEWELLRQGSCG
jgi:copper homeostasis protein (lipoprotein)